MSAYTFGIVSIICFIAFLSFLGLSVFLFFYLDIKNAYGIYTGKNFLKGVEEIQENHGKVRIKKHFGNDELQTERIIPDVLKDAKGIAHPSKQLNSPQDVFSENTTVLDESQTSILKDGTIVLDNDTIILQPTIDLEDDSEGIDIHFDVIDEIKIIHSDHIIEERGN